MGKAILSVDMVSIGLVLSHGNVEITLNKLSQLAEEYQIANQRIIGSTDTDYSSALASIVFLNMKFEEFIDYERIMKKQFKEIIELMLKYDEVYMNDEGEYWSNRNNYDADYLLRYFNLNPKEYEIKLQTKEAMKVFFKDANSKHIDAEQLNEFMKQHEINIAEIN